LVEESLTRVVQKLVEDDTSIQDALNRGYANISALARLLKPKIEEIIEGKVNISGVITALRRVRERLKPLRGENLKIIANSVISIRTDLAKISIEKTRKNLEKARTLPTKFPETFFQVLEGIGTLTLIVDQRVYNEVRLKFREDEIIDEKLDLAAIIIQSPKEIVETPGCIAEFYGALARKGINVEETVSCSTETIIVLDTRDSLRAYSILMDLIGEYRGKMNTLKILRPPPHAP